MAGSNLRWTKVLIVEDISEAFIFAINKLNEMVNNVYNVGSDSMNYSKESICNMIAQKTGAFAHFEEIL